MTKTKILIGTVTSQIKDYCWKEFKNQLSSFEHDVLIVDNSERIINRPPFNIIHYTGTKLLRQLMPKDNYLAIVTRDCMNILRDEFLKGDYTHLFVLESDVFIEKERLEQLVNLDADVANFTYPMKLKRNNGTVSLCVQSTGVRDKALMITPEESKELLKDPSVKVLNVDLLNGKKLTHCGYGCTLIKRKVLEQIEFRAVKQSNGVTPFPDSTFHYDVNKAGFKNVLDMTYLPFHYNLNNETTTYAKIIQIQNTTSRRQRRANKRNAKRNTGN